MQKEGEKERKRERGGVKGANAINHIVIQTAGGVPELVFLLCSQEKNQQKRKTTYGWSISLQVSAADRTLCSAVVPPNTDQTTSHQSPSSSCDPARSQHEKVHTVLHNQNQQPLICSVLTIIQCSLFCFPQTSSGPNWAINQSVKSWTYIEVCDSLMQLH